MESRTVSDVDAVVRAVDTIDAENFAAYGGGWPGEVGTALVDAVFSIRAQYHANTPGRGVLGRVKTLRETHPDAKDDLRAVVALGAERLAEIMGDGKTAQRPKSTCVIDAARAFLAMDPPVRTAADLLAADPAEVKRSYTGVRGLSWITAEYFQMLLGIPGVKADVMIVRFVNAALASAELPPVDAREARQLVLDAHAADSHGVGLTQYEHAVWRTQGALAESD